MVAGFGSAPGLTITRRWCSLSADKIITGFSSTKEPNLRPAFQLGDSGGVRMLRQDLHLWLLPRCPSALLLVLFAGRIQSFPRCHDDVEDIRAMGIHRIASDHNRITCGWLDRAYAALPLHRPIDPRPSSQGLCRSHLFMGHLLPQNAITGYELALVLKYRSRARQVSRRNLLVLGCFLADDSPVLCAFTFLLPLYPVEVALLLLVLENFLLQSGRCVILHG